MFNFDLEKAEKNRGTPREKNAKNENENEK